MKIEKVEDLEVGMIGFSSIRGLVGAGVLAGQTAIDAAALLRGARVENAGWITHAYILTSDARSAIGTRVMEAMPSGAREVSLAATDRIGPGFAYAKLNLKQGQEIQAAWEASIMGGIGYGFAQYAAIAALTLRGGSVANPKGWLARYVRRSPEMICSQLVDEAYHRAGFQIFDDGRPPGYVTPGALFWRCAQIGDVYVC